MLTYRNLHCLCMVLKLCTKLWIAPMECFPHKIITSNSISYLNVFHFSSATENIAKNENRAFIANQPLPPLPTEATKVSINIRCYLWDLPNLFWWWLRVPCRLAFLIFPSCHFNLWQQQLSSLLPISICIYDLYFL